MRKLKLFMAACAAMVSLGASAQLTNGTVYWIQDVSTGQFISQGDNWSTRAVAQDVGGLGFEAVFVSDGVYTLKNIMWNTVKDANVGLGVDQYVDQTPANYTLTLSDSGNGYLISYNNEYLVNNGTENAYKEKPIGKTAEKTEATVWKFLTKTEYDAAIQAYKDGKAAAYATQLGYNSVTTVADLENTLSTDFIYKEYTSSITNPTLGSNWDGWTHGKISQRNEGAGVGSGCAEFWNGCGYAKQTVSNLPNGLYKVTFVGTYRPENSGPANNLASEKTSSPAFVYANDAKIEFLHWIDVPAKANSRGGITTANGYGHSFYTYVSEGTLDLGVVADGWTEKSSNSYNWTPFGQFTLTYYSNQVSDDDATAILNQADAFNDKIMEASLKEALNTAKSTFDSNHTIANFNALTQAITNAQNSVDAYANAKAYLDEAETILAGTNVYTAVAYETYYTQPKAKYDDRTLTTAEANALVKTSTGWHSANTIDEILLSAWTFGGEQCANYEKDLYINTWSVEGVTDGSEFLTPFFEYWCDDKQSLGAKDLAATVTDLKPNTTYSFTIRARVRQTDNADPKIAKGITMQVNGGEAVDISAGTIFKTGPFYIGNFSAVGKTDANGNLTCTITVAANSNISWLSFYNCKYIEGEDLSAYIADYEFALNTATTVNSDAAYAAVTGKEKADLTAALTTYAADKVDETNKAALIAAKEALETASNTFVAAAPAYTAFVELNATVASTLGVELPTISETTVAADLNVESIIVNEYTAAKAYTEDYTDKLGDWTNAPGTFNGESWDGTTGNGDEVDTYYDLYNAAARTMTQTVTLPAGDYALIAKGRASANGLLTMTDGTETVTFAHKGSVGRGIATDGTATFADDATYANSNNGRGWEYRVLTFTSNGETATTLTFSWTTANNNWCGLDDIELRCNPVVLDYTALQTAYDAVPTLGFEEGEYAPYNNVESLAAMANAKNLLDNQDATSQTQIDNAAAALTNATWTANDEEVNAIYDGTFAAATNNGAPRGWTMSNNTLGGDYHSRAFVGDDRLSEFNETNSGFYIRFDGTNSNRGSMYYYGNTEGYTMPLKADTYYLATVDFAGWGSTGKPLRMNVTGPEGFTAVGQTINTSVRADNADNTPQQFNILFKTAGAGNYVINFQTPGADTNTHAVVISNVMLKKVENVTISETETYVPTEKYANVTFNRTLVVGWNGMVLPFDMTIDDVKSTFNASKVKDFKSVTVTDGKATLDFEDAADVKAGKPFMMKADEAGNSYTIDGVLLSAAELQTVSKENGNVKYTMTGSYAATTDLSSVVFALIQGDKYYYHNTGKSSSAKAFRAWFVNESTDEAGSRISFNFGDDIVTGINEVQTNGQNTEDIYNLQGQRVMNAHKGLFIQNGKKVVRK